MVLSFHDASYLRELRSWLREHIPDDDTSLDAELVCTELVTNALEHGGGRGVVRIVLSDADGVRVEVDDADSTAPLTLGRSSIGRHRGRGLQIVDAVASWGVVRRAGGKTVWATF